MTDFGGIEVKELTADLKAALLDVAAARNALADASNFLVGVKDVIDTLGLSEAARVELRDALHFSGGTGANPLATIADLVGLQNHPPPAASVSFDKFKTTLVLDVSADLTGAVFGQVFTNVLETVVDASENIYFASHSSVTLAGDHPGSAQAFLSTTFGAQVPENKASEPRKTIAYITNKGGTIGEQHVRYRLRVFRLTLV